MKIAIDISQVVYETGVSTYVINLVTNLLKIDGNNEYVLFGGSLRRQKDLDNFLNSLKGSYKRKILPIPPTISDILWNKLHVFPIESLVGKVDVFHSSDWTQPPSSAFKVTTVHDLVPIKFPKLSDPKLVSAHTKRFEWVVKEVDRVIVPSVTTKEDCIKLGINKDNIRVIPEAPDPIFKPAKQIEIEKLKRRYFISGKYILAVGVNARKNTDRIIGAFEKVKTGLGVKLIVVGHKYSDFGQNRGVMFLGHVQKSEMPILYSGAECLVYPSFYEGFGLPILEAFSCKTPVVTSNLGSMAEVSGRAAVLTDPYSEDSIAQGIAKALKEKNALIEKGSKRVNDFSWLNVAKKTLDVYQESLK